MFELKQLWISPNWKALLNEAGLLHIESATSENSTGSKRSTLGVAAGVEYLASRSGDISHNPFNLITYEPKPY